MNVKRSVFVPLVMLFLFYAACAPAATLSGVGIKYTGLIPLMLPAVDVILEFDEYRRVEGIFWFGGSTAIAAMGGAYVRRFFTGAIHPYLGVECLFSGALILTLKGGVEFDFGRGSIYGGAGYANTFEYGYRGFVQFECGARHYFGKR